MAGYTPKTEDQIRQQAETDYASYYAALNLAAQQAYDRNDLALQQQAAGLQSTYDKQRQASAENYRNLYSQADRQMIGRGMQRSSYGAQVLANIGVKGAEAQQALYDQQGAAEANIGAQRSQLAQQLSAQLSQYAANQQSDVLKQINALRDQEYDRGWAAYQFDQQLAMQMQQFAFQQEQARIQQEQWQKQFDESVRQFDVQQEKKSGGSSSGSGSGSVSSASNQNGGLDYAMLAQEWMKLMGYPQQPTTNPPAKLPTKTSSGAMPTGPAAIVKNNSATSSSSAANKKNLLTTAYTR